MQALSSKVAVGSTLAQKPVVVSRNGRKSVAVRAVAAQVTEAKLNTKRSEEVRDGRAGRPRRARSVEWGQPDLGPCGGAGGCVEVVWCRPATRCRRRRQPSALL